MKIFCLALLLAQIHSHAEFFLSDSSFRTAADGKLYCEHELSIGTTVMGQAVADATGTQYCKDREARLECIW